MNESFDIYLGFTLIFLAIIILPTAIFVWVVSKVYQEVEQNNRHPRR